MSGAFPGGRADRPVAVVTGGGTGIGLACAQELACDHYVVVVGRRPDVLDAAVATLGGERHRARPADVSSVDAVETLVADVIDAFGRVDVVVNAAAVRSPRLYTTTPLREAHRIWTEQLTANATSQFLTCYGFAPHLTRPGGRLVNFSSHGVITGGHKPGTAAYIAAKGAVQALTVALARELSPAGITVNAIVPGFIADTDMTDQLTPDQHASYVGLTAVGHPGRPDDIAAAVRYLVSPRASYMTGQFLHLNGGAAFARG
jgi:3-oxoacyl-[acyl-carrier protein] reductase